MSYDEKCIYCSNSFDPYNGEGDHIIPFCLGEFKNYVCFRRMCPDCNRKVGKYEQQIVQSGPEGFFRLIIKAKSKRSKRRTK